MRLRPTIFLASLVVLTACATIPPPPTRAPNVVVIVADDLGFMDVRPNNPATFYDTPNLDRLARAGMRFTDGYAACPVCSPTRYSLMTGRYPTRSGLTDFLVGSRAGRFRPAAAADRMAADEVTLAELLRARGYATFFAGKWHLGPTPEDWPERQGFDVNQGGHRGGGPYGGDKYFSPYGNPRLEDGPKGEHLPDRLAQETCNFISAQRERPFLAVLSFYSVHTPLVGRPDLVAKYEPRAAAIPTDGEFADEEQTLPVAQKRKVRTIQRHAVYAAMVEAMDQAIGKVLDQLDALALTDDTIVVFTSDNGGLSTSEGSPTSNLPLRGGKGWTYEGGIRTPWLIAAPGVIAPGSVNRTPISTIDLLPTILDLTATPPAPHAIDGQSFAPALRGEPMPERPLFWHYPHYGNQGGFPSGAVRLGAWKLIERYEDGRVHLYDLAADPGERTDLAADEPTRVEAMREQLHAFYRQHNARFLRAKDGQEPWQPGG